MYDAYVAARQAQRNARDVLLSQRLSIAERLRRGGASGADLAGLEARLKTLDAQIAAADKQINDLDAQVVKQAAVPGAVVPYTPPYRPGPDSDTILGMTFLLVVALPISIALARRLWRRGSAAVAALPAELSQRLTRLEQAMEAVAIEVERIGEGQRFVTNLMVGSPGERTLGAGEMAPIEIAEREGAQQRLRE